MQQFASSQKCGSSSKSEPHFESNDNIYSATVKTKRLGIDPKARLMQILCGLG